MNKKNWLLGTIVMFSVYLVSYYLFFIAPLFFKIVVAIALPFAFYFHIKQDWEIINKLLKKETKEK